MAALRFPSYHHLLSILGLCNRGGAASAVYCYCRCSLACLCTWLAVAQESMQNKKAPMAFVCMCHSSAFIIISTYFVLFRQIRLVESYPFCASFILSNLWIIIIKQTVSNGHTHLKDDCNLFNFFIKKTPFESLA